MLFINPNLMAAEQEPLTVQQLVLMVFWYLAAVCDVAQKAGEADCAVCVCSAGLVCMKSSTSVVELVMLLCSQVGDLTLGLLSSLVVLTAILRLTPKPIPFAVT